MRRAMLTATGPATGIPPAYVGAGAPTFFSGTTNVPRPSVSSGDTMLFLIADAGIASSFPTPSGWSLVTTNSGGAEARMFRKTAGGSEPSTYSMGDSGSFGANGIIVAFSGLNASPIRATANSALNASTLRFPSVTATAGDLLVGFGYFGSNRSATPPTGYTEHLEVATGGNRFYVCSKYPAAGGATGNADATLSGAASSLGTHVALIPA